MLSRLQSTFSLNQNNVNDYIKLCMRQYLASLKCVYGIMLCPTITLSLAMPLGLSTTLLARCDKCNEEFLFTSCNKINLKKPRWYNKVHLPKQCCCCYGSDVTGGGCNSLEELLCTIGVPSLSIPTFIKIERLLGASFVNCLGKLMFQAGLEEKK